MSLKIKKFIKDGQNIYKPWMHESQRADFNKSHKRGQSLNSIVFQNA